MLQRSIMIAALMLLAAPAAAGWTLPCIFGGCSITFGLPNMPRSRCSRSIRKLRWRKSTPTGRRMGGSRLSLMSVFLAPPPLNQRPRPGAAHAKPVIRRSIHSTAAALIACRLSC